MSRIAGVMSFERQPPPGLIDLMLASASSSGVAGTHSVQAAGSACFGFWGTAPKGVGIDGRLVVALDGRIFNHAELGDEEGDVALVASLYRRHGFAGALRLLNGDFALALYDAETDTTWLARDRFGVKPLYYHSSPAAFLFASRLRSLLDVPSVDPTPNRRFVACFAGSHYRTFDNEPTETPYQSIHQLPAGQLLQVHAGRAVGQSWWSLEDSPDLTTNERELAEQYRALLTDAVSIRLRGARKPAFTLSGGMDSSTVLALAVDVSGRKQHAYSSVYDDATYDETAEIRTMLDQTVEQWHPVRVGIPNIAAVVSRMVDVNDEPVATATWLSHFLLCEQVAREGHGGLFGGLGGDELNAGEYEYFYYFFADLKRAGQDELLAAETRKWIEYHDHPIFRKSFDAMQAGLRRLVDLSHPGRCLPDEGRLARYADVVQPEYFDLPAFRPVMDHPFRSYLKNRTYQDIYRETAPCCLRAADRQTAAFGLEVYWPFFDHRVVELMFRVPGVEKIRGGVTKHLLRQATRGVLPEETRTRIKKTGWNAPAHVWFSGEGRELLMDLVGSRAFAERGIYRVDRVRAIIDEHQEIVASGRSQENHMMFIWQLVNLELWFARINDRAVRVRSAAP
jgi:asparagine synthase (glutamine-hydrolysing)